MQEDYLQGWPKNNGLILVLCYHQLLWNDNDEQMYQIDLNLTLLLFGPLNVIKMAIGLYDSLYQ